MPLIHQFGEVLRWLEKVKIEVRIIWFFVVDVDIEIEKEKAKNYGTKAFAKKKNENTTKISKYVFTTNSFRSAFADAVAVAAVCTFVCGSSHWTATGTRVYACIDLQNDNHARMMQIIHCREEKKLDIHLSNNLHISQSSFYNSAIAMANAVGAQLFFSLAIIIIIVVVIDIIMWSSFSSSSSFQHP